MISMLWACFSNLGVWSFFVRELGSSFLSIPPLPARGLAGAMWGTANMVHSFDGIGPPTLGSAAVRPRVRSVVPLDEGYVRKVNGEDDEPAKVGMFWLCRSETEFENQPTNMTEMCFWFSVYFGWSQNEMDWNGLKWIEMDWNCILIIL